MLNTKQKLTKLRKLFPKYDIDCYLVPHTDEFQNEFLPKYSRRLEWLSNFTGSAGDIIITKNKAYIFVDGRYTIQAENEREREREILFVTVPLFGIIFFGKKAA